MNRRIIAMIALGLASLTGCQLSQVAAVALSSHAPNSQPAANTPAPTTVPAVITVPTMPAVQIATATATATPEAVESFRKLQAVTSYQLAVNKICTRNWPNPCP